MTDNQKLADAIVQLARQNAKFATQIAASASQQVDNIKATTRLQAKLDVQGIALGLTLTSLSADTSLVARIQTGLESCSENLLPKNPDYDEAFTTEVSTLLAFLPKD